MSDIKYMVAGFLFVQSEVLLVEKKSPRWQAGLLNGVGGKVNANEAFDDAMRREWTEETGLDNPEWRLFACEQGRDYCVYFYTARQHAIKALMPPAMLSVRRQNDVGERLLWNSVPTTHISNNVVGNLKWLIPLALDPRELPAVTFDARKHDISARPTW